MDKYLIKRRKTNDNEDGSENKVVENVIEDATIENPRENEKTRKIRTYLKDYLKFGFIYVDGINFKLPQCIVCGEQLSNASMVPNKLQRHLNSMHPSLSSKDADYFETLLKSQKKQSQQLLKRLNISDKAQLASYKVAEMIAVKMKPHTIAESLILPACKEIVKIMLGENSVAAITNIPLSNNTISRRVNDMSSDIAENVAEKLKGSQKYALQLDESTDISNKCQLLIYMRFIDDKKIIEQFYTCKEMASTTTGQDVYNMLTSTLEKDGISLKNCTSVCTDGAPAMTGRLKGLVSIVKKKFPHIIGIHCFIHREALMTKNLGSELKSVIDSAIKMVNFIKSRPLKTRLFRLLCDEMGSLHKSLLLHTDNRWLSKGKMLSRLYELREELHLFFQSEEKTEFVSLLKDIKWCAKLAYLADVFSHLNKLNASMQGKKENILTSSDKIDAFLKTICLWKNLLKNKKQTDMFPLLAEIDHNGELTSSLIQSHLSSLHEDIQFYFPSLNVAEFDWVRNPFCNTDSSAQWTLIEQEQLISIQADRSFKIKYNENNLETFWIEVSQTYPKIGNKAIEILMAFSTTYLCEVGFSTFSNIKNKHRERILNVEQEMRVCLSAIRPRIERLCAEKQAHCSH